MLAWSLFHLTPSNRLEGRLEILAQHQGLHPSPGQQPAHGTTWLLPLEVWACVAVRTVWALGRMEMVVAAGVVAVVVWAQDPGGWEQPNANAGCRCNSSSQSSQPPPHITPQTLDPAWLDTSFAKLL